MSLTCPTCRGLFLDRGELDRLVDAESVHSAAPPQQQYSHRGKP